MEGKIPGVLLPPRQRIRRALTNCKSLACLVRVSMVHVGIVRMRVDQLVMNMLVGMGSRPSQANW